MSRLATRQASSLPASPHTGRRGSSSSSDGWWEHVVPDGRLAERLRKAHEHPQASMSTPTTPSRRERRGMITPSASTSSQQKGTQNRAIPFPSKDVTDMDACSIGSYSSAADSVSSMKTNFDKQQHSRGTSLTEIQTRFEVPSSTRKGKAPVRGNDLRPSRPESLKNTPDTRRRPLSQSSSTPRLFPPLSSHDSRSPLSSTPEVSSGSEADVCATTDQVSRRRVRSAIYFPVTGMAGTQLPSSAASNSSKTSRSSFHSAFSRGSDRAACRKVNFEVDRERDPKSGKFDRCSQDSLIVGPKAGRPSTSESDKARSSHHASWHTFGSSTVLPTSRSTEAGQVHLPSAAESLAASGAQHWFNSTSSATMSRRRTRTLSRDVFGAQPTLTSRRTASTADSRPSSPRVSIQLTDVEQERLKEALAAGKIGTRARRSHQFVSHFPSATPDSQHLPISRSLQSAQESFFRTTSTALGFSRSLLAVPGPLLRPLFHFTLIWCVSSATLMALLSCLMMSYCLTVWDDVGVTGKASRSRSSLNRGKDTGSEERNDGDSSSTTSLTSSDDIDTGTTTSGETSPGSTPSSRRSSTTFETTRHVLDHLVLHPLTYAASLPIAVAKSLTPSMVESESSRRAFLATEDNLSTPQNVRDGNRFRGREHTGPQWHGATSFTAGIGPTPPPPKLPPRPPLTSLIPSMLFTILIAIGAGLIGEWAKKYSKPSGKSESQAPTPDESDQVMMMDC